MGRVIRGSAPSADRYAIALPPRPFSVGLGDEFGAVPDPALGDLPSEPEPGIDLAAITAQAQLVIDEATRSAQALVADAQEQATAIVSQAVQAAETQAQEVRREAHEAGLAAGREQAASEAADAMQALHEFIDAIRRERHVYLAAAEPELVKLAVGIAERIVHDHIALDPQFVVDMARVAITRIVERESVVVRVNPADLERLRDHRDELLALGDIKTLRVIEDQRVDRGGVVLETDAGTIDAKISTQLGEARKILHIVDDIVVEPLAATALPAGDPGDEFEVAS